MSDPRGGKHEHGPGEPHASEGLALRVEAIESLLVEKGLVDAARVDEIVRYYEEDVGPMHGARVVARAWVDAGYRRCLLEDATAAVAELGLAGREGGHLRALENTPGVHNVVVCSLCSCYPWPVLGLPPAWYKSPAYRSRVVREPRKVLSEMGLALPPEVEIRVWDSSAELRYLVLPERPPGTESLGEEELAALVSRDAMIGVAKARAPEPRAGEARRG
jgi:nitrile hydratase